MPVVSYCAFDGLNTYYKDEAAMRAAGIHRLQRVHQGDFHGGAEARRRGGLAAGLLEHRRRADRRRRDPRRRERRGLPQGVPQGAALLHGPQLVHRVPTRKDPHFRLAKALHVVNWNVHDEAGVKLLHDAGGDWAFYNGGNRWTYGVYMYKAAKQYGMKYRLSWHWNAAAGDPYYALDCREDDYAWCNSEPGRRADPGGAIRAAARGAGRLPPAADAGPAGEGTRRHARPPRRPTS